MVEFVGLGTLSGAFNSGLTINGGLGTASECYDIIVTFDDGSVADPVNGCHNCGEPTACGEGDFNDDGSIGGADLNILLAYWGSDNADVDLNGDGEIGGGDLTILLAAWGQQCP